MESVGAMCLSHRNILGFLSQKKRLKSRDFLEIYDAIWKTTTSVKYKNPDHALRESLEMIKKQYGGPPF
jgi:hypothetical protein